MAIRRPGADRRMPKSGQRAPRTNVGYGGGMDNGRPPSGDQRPNPRPNNGPGGMPNQGIPGGPELRIGLPGQQSRIGDPRGPGRRGRNPGVAPPPSGGTTPDYFGQLNAFQADIGGEQPGPIMQGWGGAGGNLGTMGMTKVNSWLNTFTDPTQRAQASNAIGYNNYGNPYTPEAARGTNQFYREAAQGNQAAGASGYTAPGTYLHQSGGYGAPPGQAPDMNFGGYIGATTVAPGGAAQYTPWDINARPQQAGPNRPGNGRPGGNRRPNPRPNNGPGGMPNQGVPGAGPGGAGPGGRPGGRPGGPGGGNQGFNAGQGFPQTPPPPPDFLPMTPQYEQAMRGLNDSFGQQLQGFQNQQNLIGPMVDLQSQRLQTDMGYARNSQLEDLAERGMVQSGVNPYLYNRDIGTPYGREFQDLALGAGSQYSDLMGQTGQAYGDYNSAMIEALLNRASQAAQDMPLDLPSMYPPQGTQPYGQVPGRGRPNKPRGNRRRNNRGPKK